MIRSIFSPTAWVPLALGALILLVIAWTDEQPKAPTVDAQAEAPAPEALPLAISYELAPPHQVPLRSTASRESGAASGPNPPTQKYGRSARESQRALPSIRAFASEPRKDPVPDRDARAIAGRFEYNDALAREGISLLDHEPVIIRAEYGSIGYAHYVRAALGAGGRAFLVSSGRRPSFAAEVHPLSGEIIDEKIEGSDLNGLALHLPRVLGRGGPPGTIVERSLETLGLRGPHSLVVVLPRRVEAYARAALRRAVREAGFALEDFRSFSGAYVKEGSGIALRLTRGVHTDGSVVATDVTLAFRQFR